MTAAPLVQCNDISISVTETKTKMARVTIIKVVFGLWIDASE